MTASFTRLGMNPRLATDYDATTGIHTLKVTGISGGGGSPGGSSGQLQFNNAGDFGGITGATTDGTSLILASGNLKLSGSSSGTAILNAPATGGGAVTLPAGNVTLAPTVSPTFTTPTLGVASATSINKVTLTAPATGSTLTLVDGSTLATAGAHSLTLTTTADSNVTLPTTGTLATLAGAETLSNKTLVAPALGTPASGVATNLTGTAAGLTAGSVTTNANLTGVITSVGNATSIASQTGTGTKFVTDTSPTLVTPTLGVATATSVATSAANVNTQSIGAVSTDGTVLQNTTAATVGAQKWSPRLHFIGQGWKTNTTAASQTVDFISELQTIQGSTSPTGQLVFSAQVAGGGYVPVAAFGTAIGAPCFFFPAANTQAIMDYGVGYVSFRIQGANAVSIQGVGILPNAAAATYTLGSNSAPFTSLTLAATTSTTGGAVLTSPSSANLQLGAANAASPINQTLSVQGSRAGTDSNVGGGALTIQSGIGTGIGTVSTLSLKSPVAVASGTGAQTLVTGLAINVGTAVLTSYIVANLPAAATAGAGATAFVTDASTTLVLGLGGPVTGGGANKVPVFSDGTNWNYG